jgi:hypothetical protein
MIDGNTSAEIMHARAEGDEHAPEFTTAELAALKGDAERYRWLRKQSWTQRGLFVVSANGADVVRLGTNCPSGDLLDAAIKQARKEGA